MKVRALSVITVGFVLSGCSVTMDPLSSKQSEQFGAQALLDSTANQESINGPVSLYEAMARALKYNLDTRVEVMESVLRARELNLSHYSMLPNLVASSGYAGRDQGDASSVITRDPDVVTSELSFSWNILDFGLSYFRSKQAADEALIQDEMKRKIVIRVVEDVRTAYWRAASYQELINRMRDLEARVSRALDQSRQLSSSGQNTPLVMLSYERELIEIKDEIEVLQGELMIAKSQLAALMNIRPDSNYQLSPPPQQAQAPALPSDINKLYSLAVTNRPEMREIAYRLRINDQEMKASMLELLPNFNIYAGANYDSNEFIDVHDWTSWGANISWNLMQAVSIPATRDKVDAQEQLLDARAQSVAMAIMTQVQISGLRYGHLSQRYQTSQQLVSVSHRILDQVRAEKDAERATEQTLIREEMNTLLADAKSNMVYADLQNAYANIYASVGIDPFPLGLDTNASVSDIAKSLENSWGDGRVGAMSEESSQ